MIIIIIVLILLLFLLCIHSPKENIVEGLNTFNGRMSISDQYFFDKLFDDVIYYPNKYEKDYETGEEIGKLLKTGWEECREKCRGNCIEFGISSNSYCFEQPFGDGKFI